MPLKTPGNLAVGDFDKNNKQQIEKLTIHFQEISYLNF